MDAWMDAWMDGCMDEWMHGWMDAWTRRDVPMTCMVVVARCTLGWQQQQQQQQQRGTQVPLPAVRGGGGGDDLRPVIIFMMMMMLMQQMQQMQRVWAPKEDAWERGAGGGEEVASSLAVLGWGCALRGWAGHAWSSVRAVEARRRAGGWWAAGGGWVGGGWGAHSFVGVGAELVGGREARKAATAWVGSLAWGGRGRQYGGTGAAARWEGGGMRRPQRQVCYLDIIFAPSRRAGIKCAIRHQMLTRCFTPFS
ncbi:hypothetical protein PLESTB_000762500 [Pleodorina starrii]|uniref:Uncharacterized protein n=1 Tax=Pleodorina starrii TaxID=330485 RepID=A0A9W6BLF6_9CHLO|nr:hypothetical protein PLESTB_000762500 [Pleodorina starrii]